MDEKLKQLLDKRARAWSEAQDIRERAEREDNRDLTTEEDQTYERALDDVEQLSKDIEKLQREQRLSGIMEPASPPAPVRSDDDPDEERSYAEVFDAYLRGGMNALDHEQRQMLQANFEVNGEKRAQATSPGSAGGYLIPTDTMNKLTEAMKAFGGLLGVANVIPTATGNPINWPKNDDTGNVGAILGENTQIDEADLEFGQETLGAYTYTSKLIRVSWQLLQDNIFNLEGFIARKAGERIGRAVAAHLATGTGSSQPQGLFAGATVGHTGATSASAVITYDDLVDLEHSVDPAYRNSGRCRFVLSDAMLKMVRKLKDGDDRPLWQPSLQAGVASLLNGYPYTIDQGVAAPAVSAKSLGFGDVNSGYVVRQVAGGTLVRLEERYADFLQTGFFAFLRADATVDDTSAFKTFEHGAAA